MDNFWDFVRLLAVLVIVLTAVVVFIKFGLARLYSQPYRQKGALRIVERLVLGPKCGLFLIQAGQRYFLLGVGVERVDVITELKGEDLPDIPAVLRRPGFGQYLNYYLRRGERHEGE